MYERAELYYTVVLLKTTSYICLTITLASKRRHRFTETKNSSLACTWAIVHPVLKDTQRQPVEAYWLVGATQDQWANLISPKIRPNVPSAPSSSAGQKRFLAARLLGQLHQHQEMVYVHHSGTQHRKGLNRCLQLQVTALQRPPQQSVHALSPSAKSPLCLCHCPQFIHCHTHKSRMPAKFRGQQLLWIQTKTWWYWTQQRSRARTLAMRKPRFQNASTSATSDSRSSANCVSG